MLGKAKVRSYWPGFREREDEAGQQHAAALPQPPPGAVQGCDAGARRDQTPLWLTQTEISTQGTAPQGGPLRCFVSPGRVPARMAPSPSHRSCGRAGSVVVVSPVVPV